MSEPAASTSNRWQRALYPALTILAWIAVLVVVAWLLGRVVDAVLVTVIAALLAFAASPVTQRLDRWMPQWLALLLTYLIGFAVIGGFGAIIVLTTVSQLAGLTQEMPRYARQVQGLIARLDPLLATFGVHPSSVSSLPQQMLGSLQTGGSNAVAEAVTAISTIAGLGVDVIIVFILSVYFLANGERVANWIRERARIEQRRRPLLLLSIVNRVVGGYVRGVLLMGLLIGAMVGAGMWVLGVPYPLLLGVLAFFMEFIPVLGVLVSGLASILLAFVGSGDLIHPLLVLAYFALVHVVEGEVVGPRVMGKAVGIHPAVNLIAFVAGMQLFGFWGALFASPMAGLTQAVVVAAYLELEGKRAAEVIEAVGTEEEAEVAKEVEATEHQEEARAHPPRAA